MEYYRRENESRPSISSLISGILRDATELIFKQMVAARLEMREEVANAKSTAVLMALGAVALMVGSILLALTVVYVLQAYSGLELWLCYGVVGAVIFLVGLMILFMGKRRAARTSLVPTTTIENAKEDARWITRSVKYDTR